MSNGLALLSNYGDNEEDSDDSSSEQQRREVTLKRKLEENPHHPADEVTRKKRILLPSPNISIQTKDESEDTTDDPSIHDYRVRSFAHVRGNWASYIFIDLSKIEFLHIQKSILDTIETAKAIDNPHLSLSRVVTLQYHWIKDFTSGLQARLRNQLGPFAVQFVPKLKLLVNEEATRTFITLTVQGNKHLERVVQCSDETLAEYNKEPFYKPADFHVSLAWCLGDHRETIDLKKLQKVADHWYCDNDQPFIHVSSIRTKVGNKLFVLDLTSQQRCLKK
jgi:hypothetical protein